jgi:WD40 repeat protein
MRCVLASLCMLVAFPAFADEPLPEGAVARLGATAFRTAGTGIVLSPDGKRAAVRVGDGIDVLDLDTGAVVSRLCDATRLRHPKRSPGAPWFTFAFTPGGREIVTATAERRVWVWDVPTGKPLRSIPGPAHEEFTADGKKETVSKIVMTVFNCQLAEFLVAETWLGWMKLDVKTGTWLAIKRGDDRISDVSPDGRWVIGYTDQASIENSVSVVDTEVDQRVYAGESGGSYPFRQTPSPDGRLVACTTVEAGPQVWEVATKREVMLKGVATKGGHGTPRFTPDGKELVVDLPESVYDEKTPPHFARWDVTTGERLSDWMMPARVTSWAVDHANNRLVAIAGQGVYRIDIATGVISPPQNGFLGAVRAAISADGTFAAVGDSAGLVKLYRAGPAGAPRLFAGEPTTLRAGGGSIDDLIFSADAKTLFMAYPDRSVGVWDVADGRETAVLAPPVGPERHVWFRTLQLAVSPDGRTLACEASGQALWAWDVATGKVLWTLGGDGKRDAIIGCRPVFAPDAQSLYRGCPHAQVAKLDARTGQELARVQIPGIPEWGVTRLAVLADGKKLAAHVYNNVGHLVVFDWELKSERVPMAFRLENAVGGMAFTADGSAVVTTHPDGTLRGRRSDNPGMELFTFRGPTGYTRCLQLTADGTLAITDAPGATAIVWELPRE